MIRCFLIDFAGYRAAFQMYGTYQDLSEGIAVVFERNIVVYYFGQRIAVD